MAFALVAYEISTDTILLLTDLLKHPHKTYLHC